MTALNLPGFDDGEPTFEVWEVRPPHTTRQKWMWEIYRLASGWHWIDYALGDGVRGPFPTRDAALADAIASGADVSDENTVC